MSLGWKKLSTNAPSFPIPLRSSICMTVHELSPVLWLCVTVCTSVSQQHMVVACTSQWLVWFDVLQGRWRGTSQNSTENSQEKHGVHSGCTMCCTMSPP